MLFGISLLNMGCEYSPAGLPAGYAYQRCHSQVSYPWPIYTPQQPQPIYVAPPVVESHTTVINNHNDYGGSQGFYKNGSNYYGNRIFGIKIK